MKWIDGHLDLAYLHVNGRDIRQALLPHDAAGCISLPALRDAGVEIAFATIFTEPGKLDPAQQREIQAAIIIGEEDILAVVAALDDMMRQIRNDDAGHARHATQRNAQ